MGRRQPRLPLQALACTVSASPLETHILRLNLTPFQRTHLLAYFANKRHFSARIREKGSNCCFFLLFFVLFFSERRKKTGGVIAIKHALSPHARFS